MPKQPTRRPDTTPPAPPASPIELTGRAAALYDEVLASWDLDAVATAILRLACESMARADEAAAIVTREGLCVPDRWGRPSKHPASLLERDHRAAAAQSLQKLGLALGAN
jgi:hypothetical protein